MLEFQIVGSRVEESELRDLKAMLLAIGVANGAEYVESLRAQALTLEREQTRGKSASCSEVCAFRALFQLNA